MLKPREALKLLREMGCSCSIRDGEIRVRIRGQSKLAIYYTYDPQDAVDTGRSMIREQRQLDDEKLEQSGSRSGA